jgi:hypothetical protein
VWDNPVDSGVIRQRSGVAWVLLPCGASADFRDNEGGTQLMLVSQEHLSIIRLLLYSGGAVDLSDIDSLIPSHDEAHPYSNPRSIPAQ